MKVLNLGIIVFIPFFVGCTNGLKQKNVEFRAITGEKAKGILYPDSVLHGVVRYYSPANGEYRGYTIFKHGIEVGPYVKIDKERKIDSFAFNNPIRNGYEYLFDSLGRLSYKAYLLNDRVVGPTCTFDTLGKEKEFYFYSFEGDILYQVKFEDTDKLYKGQIINFKVHDRYINDSTRTLLFLYMIHVPRYVDYYELGVMDEKRKLIRSSRIKTGSFYYETILDPISPTQHYAIIYHSSYIKMPGDKVLIQEIYL